jgi:hypothetical protein
MIVSQISGWWLTYPSEKWWSESQIGSLSPIWLGKIIQPCSKPPTSIYCSTVVQIYLGPRRPSLYILQTLDQNRYFFLRNRWPVWCGILAPRCAMVRSGSSHRSKIFCSQWEFQDPKGEVLYHIRPYFVGIFPYIGLT